MRELLLVLVGVVGTILVETAIVVGIAIKRVIAEHKLTQSGPNSVQNMRETVVPVLKQE